jgi:hypothetical protein
VAHQNREHQREPLCAFESKLLELFSTNVSFVFEQSDVRIGLEQQGSAGDVALTLVAQDMRDFCLLDFLEQETLASFAKFFLSCLEEAGASRARIGPFSGRVSSELEAVLQRHRSDFVFRDAVLAVEPLLKKRANYILPRSLNRALRKILSSGFEIRSECLPVTEMSRLHVERWGSNRNLHFFRAMEAFAKTSFCECISIGDGEGRIVGQQIDFCLIPERRFYYSVSNHARFPGIGTALLSESVRRFTDRADLSLYSFGRGGEVYKYRYANFYRLNHYLLGFRVNDCEEI